MSEQYFKETFLVLYLFSSFHAQHGGLMSLLMGTEIKVKSMQTFIAMTCVFFYDVC